MRTLELSGLSPIRTLDALARDAFIEPIASDRLHYALRAYREKGTPLPEQFLPGRKIMSLPADVRETLSKLTSKDIENFVPYHVWIEHSPSKRQRRRFYRLGGK